MVLGGRMRRRSLMGVTLMVRAGVLLVLRGGGDAGCESALLLEMDRG
jgi:hypothetical protein